MKYFSSYSAKLASTLELIDDESVSKLELDLINLWNRNGKLFICGNGGSGGNAIHLANDFIFGAGYPHKRGLNVEALTANSAILTCIANDLGYEKIFSYQIYAKAVKEDLVLVLSGSGNSQNIIEVITAAKQIGVKTHSILGFSGGEAKVISDSCIHINCDDMQICEDVQLILGHHLVQRLNDYAQHRATTSASAPVKH